MTLRFRHVSQPIQHERAHQIVLLFGLLAIDWLQHTFRRGGGGQVWSFVYMGPSKLESRPNLGI